MLFDLLVCLFSLPCEKSEQFIKQPQQLHSVIQQQIKLYVDIKFSDDQVYSYPLRSKFLIKNDNSNITFLGNAAYSLHPIMAQGFNLGVKNLQLLVKILSRQGLAGIKDYDKISHSNAIKTEKVVNSLAYYAQRSNSTLQSWTSKLGVKDLLWTAFEKSYSMQKFFFNFLKY